MPLPNKTTFIVLVTLLIAGGLIVTSLAGYFVGYDSLKDEVADSTLPLTSDTIYSEIQQDLLRPIFISSVMAQDTFLRDWKLAGEQEPDSVIRYLAEIQKRYGTVTAFFISDATLRYYHPEGVLKTVSPDDPGDAWYFRARAMDADYEVNVDWDTADRSRLTIFINYKVFDYDGNLIGITGVGLKMEAVKMLLDTYQRVFGRTVYFVDRLGGVTVHSAQYDGPLDITKAPGISSVAKGVLSSPNGSFTYQGEDGLIFLNSRLVPEFQWYLMVEQDDVPQGARLLRTLLVNLAISASVCVVVLAIANVTVGRYQRHLEQMATTDELTGAANRQAFEMTLTRELALTERTGQPVSGLMFDLDHFKQVNDRFGHLAGDAVLTAFVERVQARLRETDVLCRWGGEEFVAMLPGAGLDETAKIAEEIRAALAAEPIQAEGQAVPLTVSIGFAEAAKGETEEAFVRRMDKALYEAKHAGRDRVVAG
ncbi:MAG: sensor domain-containing diguanylate cyclase [Magnetovibrionaceae bacterium]